MRTLLLAAFLLASAVATAEDKAVLLTGNGLTNPKYSQYKNAPTVELKNAGYYAVPPMLGEAGSAEKPIPFTQGILTNGDSSSAWKRKPGPYTYWTSKPKGELFFELGRPCRIARVRVRLLFSPTSACKSITLYDRGQPGQAKEALLLGKVEKPVGAWNEIKDLDKVTDGLRIEFEGAGKTYIHVTEIEIWGVPVEKEAQGGGG